MSINLIPDNIQEKYEIFEWHHATSILYSDFNVEFNEIIHTLDNFTLNKTDILKRGGRKSPIASKLDTSLYDKGWVEKDFKINISIDNSDIYIPTHSIDCYKNKVGIEVEWNNKDPFFDRDLNNFRLLFDLHAIDVGIIITRCTHLQSIFNSLGKGDSYGSSTTHMDKLIPRIQSQGAGGCPILAFGISKNLYVED